MRGIVTPSDRRRGASSQSLIGDSKRAFFTLDATRSKGQERPVIYDGSAIEGWLCGEYTLALAIRRARPTAVTAAGTSGRFKAAPAVTATTAAGLGAPRRTQAPACLEQLTSVSLAPKRRASIGQVSLSEGHTASFLLKGYRRAQDWRPLNSCVTDRPMALRMGCSSGRRFRPGQGY